MPLHSTEELKAASPFSLYQFADRLRERGWLAPAYSMPPLREDMVIQRILVRHGFTRAMADTLLLEITSLWQELAWHPPAQPSSRALVGME